MGGFRVYQDSMRKIVSRRRISLWDKRNFRIWSHGKNQVLVKLKRSFESYESNFLPVTLWTAQISGPLRGLFRVTMFCFSLTMVVFVRCI